MQDLVDNATTELLNSLHLLLGEPITHLAKSLLQFTCSDALCFTPQRLQGGNTVSTVAEQTNASLNTGNFFSLLKLCCLCSVNTAVPEAEAQSSIAIDTKRAYQSREKHSSASTSCIDTHIKAAPIQLFI